MDASRQGFVQLIWWLWLGGSWSKPALPSLTEDLGGIISHMATWHHLDVIHLDMDVDNRDLLISLRKLLARTKRAVYGFEPHDIDRATKASPALRPASVHFKIRLGALAHMLASETNPENLVLILTSWDEIAHLDSFIGNASLRIDSNIYLISENTTFPGTLDLHEIYRLHPTQGRTRVERFASWSEGRLVTTTAHSKWERRSDLNGITLRIAALPSQPYLSLHCFRNSLTNCSISGMYADVFHVLQDVLNFTYEFRQPEVGTWGTSADDGLTYDGMIGQLQTGQIDIAPTSFTVMEERSRVVDFAFPITEMHHRFFIPNPKASLNWTAYTDPLADPVWVVLAIFSLLVPLLLWWSVSLTADPERQQFCLYRAFAFVIGALTFARPWSVVPRTKGPRLIFLAITLAGSLVYWHWEAMLISFLAIKTQLLPFTTLQNLIDGTGFRIAVLPGTSFADIFRLSPDPMWRGAWGERIAPNLDEYPQDKDSLIDLMLSQDDLTVFDNYYSIKTFPAYKQCLIVDIPKAYESKAFSYALAKGSPYLPLFNYYLQVMKESGGLDQIISRYVTDEQPACTEMSAGLGLDNCFTAILILMGGLTASSLCLLVELSDHQLGRSFLRYFHQEADQASTLDEYGSALGPTNHVLRVQVKLIEKLRRQSTHIRSLEAELALLRQQHDLRFGER